MSVGKLRGHLFTIKTQAEGALVAQEAINRELGALKKENSTNKYLLQRIENIVFGKHNPKGDTEDLVERIKSAVEQDETLKEIQRLRNLEFSLRNELNKVEKDLSSWRQGYDQLFSLFGRLQDLVLGKDSVTETYEDLYKPIEKLVGEAANAKSLKSVLDQTREALKLSLGENIIDAARKLKEQKVGARTYTPPEGHILVENEAYQSLVERAYAKFPDTKLKRIKEILES